MNSIHEEAGKEPERAGSVWDETHSHNIKKTSNPPTSESLWLTSWNGIFEVYKILKTHHGKVVTKEMLQWVFTENRSSLPASIHGLRKKLNWKWWRIDSLWMWSYSLTPWIWNISWSGNSPSQVRRYTQKAVQNTISPAPQKNSSYAFGAWKIVNIPKETEGEKTPTKSNWDLSHLKQSIALFKPHDESDKFRKPVKKWPFIITRESPCLFVFSINGDEKKVDFSIVLDEKKDKWIREKMIQEQKEEVTTLSALLSSKETSHRLFADFILKSLLDYIPEESMKRVNIKLSSFWISIILKDGDYILTLLS